MIVKAVILSLAIMLLLLGCVSKESASASMNLARGKVAKTVELCEKNNPEFSYDEACRSKTKELFPDKSCSFVFDSITNMPVGSCAKCAITCD